MVHSSTPEGRRNWRRSSCSRAETLLAKSSRQKYLYICAFALSGTAGGFRSLSRQAPGGLAACQRVLTEVPRGPLCDDRPVNQRFHVRQSQFITPPMFLHLASHRSSQVARVWHVSVVGFSAGRWNGEKGKVSLTVIWSQMIHWGEKDILRHWAALSTHLCPLSLRLLLCPADSIYGNGGENVAHLAPVRQKREKKMQTKQNKSPLWKVAEREATVYNPNYLWHEEKKTNPYIWS